MKESSSSIDGKKLGIPTKLGYGVGQLGDALGYNVFYSFFIFFLTDIVGLSSSVAGVVSLLAVIWDAVTDLIFGFLSDNYRGRNGRRRPFMFASIIPYGICMFLLFYDVPLPISVKSTYYILISMLFFTFYTSFTIPYFTLGGELTDDFDERTSIRVFASLFTYIGVLFSAAAPHMIVEITQRYGGSAVQGWRNVGIVFGVFIALSIAFCCHFLKGKEKLSYLEQEKEKPSEFIKAYVSVMKFKPSKILALTIFLWAFSISIFQGSNMYFTSSVLGYSAQTRSLLGIFAGVIAIVWLPFIDKLSVKFDKKNFYGFAMFFSGISGILFRYVIGFPSSPVYLILLMTLTSFGNTTFWTIAYSMMYDIGELDDFVNNKKRLGVITSVMIFFQKIGSGLALWLTGILLAAGGYDAAASVQTVSAATAVLDLSTALPGIIGVAAGIIAMFYPITKKRYQALVEAGVRKNKGMEFSTEGFENVL